MASWAVSAAALLQAHEGEAERALGVLLPLQETPLWKPQSQAFSPAASTSVCLFVFNWGMTAFQFCVGFCRTSA